MTMQKSFFFYLYTFECENIEHYKNSGPNFNVLNTGIQNIRTTIELFFNMHHGSVPMPTSQSLANVKISRGNILTAVSFLGRLPTSQKIYVLCNKLSDAQ